MLAAGTKAGAADSGPALVVIAWLDDPEFNASRIAAFDAHRKRRWLGESDHPVYVRPEAVLGAVYPSDLLNVAGTDKALYFRAAQPMAASRVIASGRFMVMPFVPAKPGRPSPPDFGEWLAGALRQALSEGRLPVRLQFPALETPLRLAYLEPTDREGAFEAEYGSVEKR